MLKFKVNITIKLFCHKIVIEITSSGESRKKDPEYSNSHTLDGIKPSKYCLKKKKIPAPH